MKNNPVESIPASKLTDSYIRRIFGAKGSKMKNIRVEYDNKKFASKRERDRYINLKLLLKEGKIRNLRLQVKFVLIERDPAIKGDRATVYIADFVYDKFQGLKGWVEITEDVKGVLTQIYKLKKKLFEARYKTRIRET